MPDEEVSKDEKKAGKGGILSLVPLIVQILTLLLVAATFWYMKFVLPKEIRVVPKPGPQNSSKVEGKKAQSSKKAVVHLDPFLVNLSGSGDIRYLKLTVDLVVSPESGKDEIASKLPEIRDRIILILSNKTVSQVMDALGKERLKDEIKRAINSILTSARVKQVLFTEFIVQ